LNKYDVKIEKFEDEEIVVGNPEFYTKEEFVDTIEDSDIKEIGGTYGTHYIRLMNTTGVICNDPIKLEFKNKHGNIKMHSIRYLPKSKY